MSGLRFAFLTTFYPPHNFGGDGIGIQRLARGLVGAGHEVTVAFDGRTGIEAVRAAHPDVLLCDIGLPGGVDGYAVGRALRAERDVTPALMVALSGYSQDKDRRRSRAAGFDAHLAKPADLEKLDALLATVSRHP